MNNRYVEFNNMIYPSSWFKYIINLSDLSYEKYDDLYEWALDCNIPFILDIDHKDKIYLMNDEDVMAVKLQWL